MGKSNIKILHIIPSLAKGGAERLAIDICNTLNLLEEVTVKLITFSPKNDYEFLTGDLDYEVIPSKVIPSIFGETIFDTQALTQAIEQFGPDIIHNHLFEADFTVRSIGYHKAVYFTHFHDNMIQLANLSWKTLISKIRVTNFYEKLQLLKRYKLSKNHFICISPDTYRYCNETLSASYGTRSLLPNAIDVTRFVDIKKAEKQPLDLVIIGSLVPKKGHKLAIETVNELHQRGIKVRLHVLGDGANKQSLLDLTSSFKLSDFIIFHGKVDYPEQFLWSSSVYLHTAFYEPFGLVIIEAMASGLPVVCTDGKGNRELIEEGKNGFMLKNRKATEVADKVELLLTDTLLREEMGNYAQTYATSFDIKNYTKKLLQLYRDEIRK